MLSRILGLDSTVTDMKAELTRSKEAVRGIGHRVANASNGQDRAFASALQEAGNVAGEEVDLEREMVALADEQLRFEATARLLEKVYQQIRLSVRAG